ncbi:MAG TPA: hypothetical protein VGF48_26615 [Thermoanaerobaculia bacterium]|jgi:hypothetical protein
MRSALLALAILFAFTPAALPQCVTSYYSNNGADSIGVLPGFGVGGSDISAAVGMWSTCSSFGSGFPSLVSGGTGTFNISVEYVPGRNPDSNAMCGVFQHELNSNNQVVGGTIFIYELAGANGVSCASTRAETIAHELGHVLGLGNSACPGYIMYGSSGTAGTRSVNAEECNWVDYKWTGPNDSPGDNGSGDPLGDCQSPLILDLNGDGIHTVGLSDPVLFDYDGDGDRDTGGWTNPSTEEGFLWIDLDTNHRVDGGHELLGVGTVLPDGTKAPNGFEALRVYDRLAEGGNADGEISVDDAVWGRLRIWVDRNSDGLSQPTETGPIHRFGVTSISLVYVIYGQPEANGNVRLFRSTYTRRVGGIVREAAIEDVFFTVEP